MIWGTGLSPYVTTHTAPNYWPGKNWLGGMLTELTQKLIHEDANVESEGDVNDVIEVEMAAADFDQHDHTEDLNLQNVDETVDELGGTDHDFNEHTSNAVSLPSDVPTDESNAEPKVTQEPVGETSTTSTMSVVSRTSGRSGTSTSKASGSRTSTSRGRSQKTPLSDRTPRRGSHPSSAAIATSKKGTDLKKKTVLNTPNQQDIRNVLKRNKPDSSPQDPEDSKQVSKQVKAD